MEKFLAIIRRLAEVEWPCWCCKGTGYTSEPLTGAGQSGPDPGAKYICGICTGTGRIVLFPLLRVECPVRFLAASPLPHKEDCSCEGRGWVPEPNVEKACWRVENTLRASHEGRMYLNDAVFLAIDPVEAVLSAAEVWAKREGK